MFKHGFPPEWSTLKKLIWLVGTGIAGAAAGVWKTVTGTLIHITDALASPMQKCEVTLEPIQDGSGDPSPTNVRPITGWTGCKVTRTGKNILDRSYGQSLPYTSGYTVSAVDNGGIQISGNSQSNCFWNATFQMSVGQPCEIYRGKKVYFSCVDVDGNNVSGVSTYTGVIAEDGSTKTFNNGKAIPDDAKYFRFYIKVNAGTDFSTPVIVYPQVELGETRTSYESPNSTTLSVTFPDSAGTVYGGTVDLVSGVLTVDRKLAVLTHTMAWEKGAANTQTSVFFLSDAVVSDKSPASWDSVETIANWAIKSTAKSTEAAHMVSGRYYWTTADGYWRVGYGTPDTTVNEFKAFLQTNPLQVVCPITTPINYQLTPQEISTLAGENNVWGDGTIELTYKAQAE